MKRRNFIDTSLLSAFAAGNVMLSACSERNKTSKPVFPVENMNKNFLDDLKKSYRYYLFEDFLPFMDKHVIDHEYGGFMCETDRDGRNITKNKRAWYEGRGIWVYSFLYNNFGKEKKYLAIAEKSVNLIMKNKPDPNGFWPESMSQTGEPIGGPDLRGYGNLFIAQGLDEYSYASGKEDYHEFAKKSFSILSGIMIRTSISLMRHTRI